jgi:GTPase
MTNRPRRSAPDELGVEEEDLVFDEPSVIDRAPTETLPIVAICGRPNVGKSTLLNRIVGKRLAIVEERPGVTRDRFEREASWRGRRFTIVDTGGILEGGDELDQKVTRQSLRAVEEADVVLLVLDTRTGITAEDDVVAQMLRRVSKRVIVVANKVDSISQEADAWALGRYGFSELALASALHGRGVGDLLDLVVDRLPASDGGGDSDEEAGEPSGREDSPGMAARSAAEAAPEPVASIAIVGRPNVGKSTLFNRLVGEDRSVVHDIPGTTRDAIDTIVETSEGLLRFVDTAGLRRRSRIDEGTEYYSLVRSLRAIDQSDIALLVIDASQGVTHQEQRLAERVDAAGSPILIVLNKWDLCPTEQRLQVAEDVADRLGFLAYAPVLRVSALSGLGVHRLLPALRQAIDAYNERVPTGRLNEALRQIQTRQPPAHAHILYGVQGAAHPPTFTLFTTGRLQPTYIRYLERALREQFDFGPTPLKIRIRPRGGR